MDCAEDQTSLINSVHLYLTVMNITLTVTHALRPSSPTHSLQIYCTGLIGPRSHTSWAWAGKRDPTVLFTFKMYVKFYVNWVSFFTQSINSLFCLTFKILNIKLEM